MPVKSGAPLMLPIVYHPEYVSPLPQGHRFPMDKFGMLYKHLQDARIASTENTRLPEPASDDDLMLVHDPDYVRSFSEGTLPEQAIRRIGLPWSAGLVRRTKRAVGGTLLTARLALRQGLAVNTAGGTHHAHPGFGSGFCIFNDLAVAARRLVADGSVQRVLIFDLDVHQGDGTAVAVSSDSAVFCVDVHCAENFPFHKQTGDIDVALPTGTTDIDYLVTVRETLDRALTAVRPDLVLYDAGVDVFSGDRLGKLDVSEAGIEQRDRLVLSRLVDAGIPVAAVIGGGYQKDLARLVTLHATLHQVAASL